MLREEIGGEWSLMMLYFSTFVSRKNVVTWSFDAIHVVFSVHKILGSKYYEQTCS